MFVYTLREMKKNIKESEYCKKSKNPKKQLELKTGKLLLVVASSSNSYDPTLVASSEQELT